MHPSNSELNEYVEGSLSPIERQTIQQHVEACAACRSLVVDLQELRRVAATLEAREPPPAVWSRIEAAVQREPSSLARPRLPEPSRPTFARQPPAVDASDQNRSPNETYRPYTLWWLSAAAAVLLAAVLIVRTGYFWPGRAAQSTAADETPTAQSIEAELALAEQHYQKAISGLEQIATAEKGSLDPGTAATLQKNLSVVDQAISESRAALRAQPDSEPAQQSLLDTFKAKVSLLQDTVALINELRNGNEAGTAQILSDLKKGK